MKTGFERPTRFTNAEKGVALIAVLLLLIVASGFAIGLMYTVNTEQRLQVTDQGTGLAYYGAEAGMEKMMADLGVLYSSTASPTPAQIAAVGCPPATVCGQSPPAGTLNGTSYSDYSINVPLDANGNPAYQQRTISSGANAGLQADILSLTLSVSADQAGQQEVHMLRNVEIALIPVFQFGVFSDGDLDYFAGPNFTFGGRVHTNSNLFPAEGGGSLVFLGPVRAVRDVVRDTLENGVRIGTNGDTHTSNVYFPTVSGGCNAYAPPAAPPATCRALSYTGPDEGSSTNGAVGPPTSPAVGGVANPAWNNLSQTTYNGMVLNGVTGAKALQLPFVQNTFPPTNPIEIVRRAQPADTQALTDSRLYNKAQVRVLLSDSPVDLPGGAGDAENIQLSNTASSAAFTGGWTAAGGAAKNTWFATENTAIEIPNDWSGNGWPDTGGGTKNLVGGWLRVEVRDAAGNYSGGTDQLLNLGIARPQAITDSEHGVANTINPQAILIFEQPRDGVVAPASTTDYYPINMYDVREGNFRDINDGACRVNGVLNLVDIDVKNLQTWLTAHPNVENQSQNGYVLYFSDRRGMLSRLTATTGSPVGVKVGEYGFEDTINEGVSAGTPNGVLDQGEDVNGNNVLDTYGGTNLGMGFNAAGNPIAASSAVPALGSTSCNAARKNAISGARHGVRLINGSLGNLPLRPNGDPNNNGGFTLVSENPAYVVGNFNANDAGFGDPHASAAVLADTVTLLSGFRAGAPAQAGWSDKNSFANSTNLGNRSAQSNSFRLAIASGKNLPFSWAAVAVLPNGTKVPTDYGTDGGMHNFLRYLESWGNTLSYEGSMVSLYYSAYATGVFKCCTTVYSPPNRNYNFDQDFTDLSKIPPGTPRFEDVVNVGFRQDFTNVK